MRRQAASLAGLLATLLILGCGGASRSAASSAGAGAAEPDIARVHRTKCGACHARIDPGERSRPELEKALARHHARVHLSEEGWQRLIDYLART